MKIFEKFLYYDIIRNGDFMKEIKYFDIQKLLNDNYNIEPFLIEISNIIKTEYPNFEEWFNQKVIPDLYLGKRNIVIAYKNNEVVGFVNLKKKNNEKTISNLYIKTSRSYRKIWNNLIDRSIDWLETSNPKFIIPYNKLEEYGSLIINRNWEITSIVKFNNNNHDVIFNGKGNEFERLLYKRKMLTNCTNKINYK